MTEETSTSPVASHAVLTGPIHGTVTLSDGTEVDVSDVVVMVDSPEMAAEVADLIGQRYAAEGHPDVPVSDENPDGFVYEPPQPEEN